MQWLSHAETSESYNRKLVVQVGPGGAVERVETE